MEIKALTEECRQAVEKVNKTYADIKDLVQQMAVMLTSANTAITTANTTMTNAITLSSDMKEDHKQTKLLYDQMHKIQQDHISKGQEWIEEQKKSIGTMRSSLVGIKDFIEEKIDSQTKITEENLDKQIKIVLTECKTAKLPTGMFAHN